MKTYFKLGALLVTLALLLTACAGSDLPHKSADGSVSFDGFTLSATASAPYGTAPDSAFLLTTPEGYSAADVKKMLSTEPAFDFDVAEREDGGFTITPKKALELGSEYALTLNPVKTTAEPKTFKFTTVKPLAYSGSYPADGGADIPVDFALEFTFTMPVTGIEKLLSFEPALTGTYQYIGNKAVFLPDGGQVQPYTTYKVTLAPGAAGIYGGELAEGVSFSFTTGDGYRSESAYQLATGGADNAYYETFLPDEYPMINVTSNNYNGKGSEGGAADKTKFSVTVNALSSSDDYLYYIYQLRGMQKISWNYALSVDTEGLEQVCSFTQEVDFSSEFAQQHNYEYISFPDMLAAGWYVATITTADPAGGPDIVMQKLIQVSPITYYQQTYNGEGLLWLNNGVTGEAVADASFSLYRDPTKAARAEVSTDKNGMALFQFPAPDPEEPRSTYDGDPTPIEEQPTRADYAFYYTVRTEGGSMAGVAYSDVAKDKAFEQKYYTYIYTDRAVYRQTDTVEFWGLIQPRSAEYAEPAQLRVMFGDYNDPLLEQTVEVGEDGTFRGSFKLDNVASSYYNVSFCDVSQSSPMNYQDVCSSYVNVYQYQKPDYTYESSTDKEFYNYSDTVTAKLSVNFFDGTPASNMAFLSSYYVSDPWYSPENNTPVSTDRNGEIANRVSLPDLVSKEELTGLGWRPATLTFEFTNDQAEGEYFSMTASAPFFPSDTMVMGSAETNGGKASLTVNVNKLDLTKLQKFEDWADDDYANIKGEPLAKDAHIEIIHSFTVRTQTGTYYDPYTKKTVPSYAYEYREESYATFNKKTDGSGKLTLTGLPACTETDSYTAIITVTDGLGNPLTEEVYLGDYFIPRYSGKGYQPNYNGKNYSFNVDTTYPAGEYDSYPWSTKLFNAGDDMKVTLYENGAPAEIAENGRWITNIVQNSVTSTGYQTGSSMSIKANEDVFPNFMLCGAYFDGRRVYVISYKNMALNTDDMALDVSVTTDAQSYLPGSKMSATVTVRDKAGNPVKNASVCLGVVNEAVFAVQEQYIYLTNVYNACFDPYPVFSCSFNQRGVENPESGGKGGGGGDGAMTMRTNFKDTIGVVTGTTGADGTASFDFDLSDDLTSWRLTALALSPELLVGNTKDTVVSTLPFFVRPIMNSYALSGEPAAIMLRGFGTDVTEDEAIGFTVSVDGGEPVSYNGKVGGYTAAALGKLAAGEHKIAVTGKCGGYSDGIESTLTVVDTAMEMNITKWFDLSKEKISIDTDKSPITVTLTNSDWEPFLKAAFIVDSGWADRNDEKLARELSGGALAEFFGGTAFLYGDYLSTPSVTDMQNSGGKSDDYSYKTSLLYLLPYGEGDAIFTGRAAVAAPEPVTNSGMSYGIEDALYKLSTGEATLTGDERAALLMGLCSLIQNSLGDKAELSEDDIQYVYNDVEIISADILRSALQTADISTRARCYLITALSYVDRTEAAKLYKDDIAPLLKTEGEGKYIPAEGDTRAVTVTAAALMTAIKTGVTDDTTAMVEYIAEKQGSIYTRGDAALEAAMYMNSFQPERSAAPVVSYKLDGKTVKADLDKAKAVKIVMTKAEFDGAGFKLESGTATAQVDYSGSPADAGFEPSDAVTLTREFKTETEGLGGITAIVYHIKFAAGAEYGCYRLTDWVPSNMRARTENSWNESIYAAYGGDGYWSRFDMENQLFNGYIWYGEGTGREFTIVLRCQNVIESDALTDSAYLLNTETMAGTVLAGGDTFSWK